MYTAYTSLSMQNLLFSYNTQSQIKIHIQCMCITEYSTSYAPQTLIDRANPMLDKYHSLHGSIAMGPCLLHMPAWPCLTFPNLHISVDAMPDIYMHPIFELLLLMVFTFCTVYMYMYASRWVGRHGYEYQHMGGIFSWSKGDKTCLLLLNLSWPRHYIHCYSVL